MTVIIIVNHNGYDDTIECLQSLFSLTDQNFYVIIIDNSQTDESISHLIEWLQKPYKVKTLSQINPNEIQLPSKIDFKFYEDERYLDEIFGSCRFNLIHIENNGFAAANNVAIRWALTNLESQSFWLLNNDTVVEKNSLKNLCSFLLKEQTIGIIGSVLLEYKQPNIIQAVGSKYSKYTALDKSLLKGKPIEQLSESEKFTIDYPIGASLFVNRKFVEVVGLMDESFFLYFEELDWVLRGKINGFETDYVENSFVWHKAGYSINRSYKGKSKLADYFSIRNRILFTKKFYKNKIYGVLFFNGIVILNRILRKQFDRVPFILKICICQNISNKEVLQKSIGYQQKN